MSALVGAPRDDSPAAGPSSSPRVQAAWRALAQVLDPELPMLSVLDLGLVREVLEGPDGALEVVVTPTYSGCPATEVIARSIGEALAAAGLVPLRTRLRLAPAWTSDWLSAQGRRKLREAGIAQPGPAPDAAALPIRIVRGAGPRAGAAADARAAAPLACPRCGSAHTERLSAFGATACKALHRCLDCREPFEHFKPI